MDDARRAEAYRRMREMTFAGITTEDLFVALRDRIEGRYEVSRERSSALTKVDEAELWLTRAEPIHD